MTKRGEAKLIVKKLEFGFWRKTGTSLRGTKFVLSPTLTCWVKTAFLQFCQPLEKNSKKVDVAKRDFKWDETRINCFQLRRLSGASEWSCQTLSAILAPIFSQSRLAIDKILLLYKIERLALGHISRKDFSTQKGAKSSFNHVFPSTALTCSAVMIYYTAKQDLLSQCVNTFQIERNF